MSAATEDREKAASYADEDLLSILYSQHARVHELLDLVGSSAGGERADAFDELQTLLRAHETAEQGVVRPVTEQVAEVDVAEARKRKSARPTRSLRSWPSSTSTVTSSTSSSRSSRGPSRNTPRPRRTASPPMLDEFDEQQRSELGRTSSESFGRREDSCDG